MEQNRLRRELHEAFARGGSEMFCRLHNIWELACRKRDYLLAAKIDGLQDIADRVVRHPEQTRINSLNNYLQKTAEAA